MTQITIKKVYASIVPSLTIALTSSGTHPCYKVCARLQYCTKRCPSNMYHPVFPGLAALVLNIHFQVFA